jgi:hypothetical protein
MSDKILVEYQSNLNALIKEHKTYQDEIKATEVAGVKASDNIAKSTDKATNSTKSLKAQLRDLKAQIATATDPKEIDRLSKAAGELSDKINDANESVKVFASGSKFQQIGNAFGTIVSNVRSLDFQRASEQSKVLLGITKSITFKEAVGGIKDVGSTLLNLGKSLLLNPLFLIPALIGLIVENFEKLKTSGGIIGQTFQFIGKAVEVLTAGIKGFLTNMGLIDTQAQEIYERQKARLDKIAEAHQKTSDRIVQILKAQGKETFDVQQQAAQQELNLIERKYNALRKAILSGAISEEEGFKQIEALGQQKADVLTKLTVSIAEENKKQVDDEKAKNKKLKEEDDKRLKDVEAQQKTLRDLRTQNIEVDFEREKQLLKDKLADDIKQYSENGAIIAELRIQYINNLNKLEAAQRAKEQQFDQEKVKASKDRIDAIQKQEDDFEEATRQRNQRILEDGVESMKKEVDARQRLNDQIVNSISEGLGSLSQITKNISDKQIQDIEQRKGFELSSLEDQYKNQLISKEQYEKERSKIELKARQEESQIKRKQFETDKQIALIQAAINTAQAVTKALASTAPPASFALAALMGVLGAAQIAAIVSQPTPKFAKGGKVEGNLHSQGGTLIEAERDEMIIRRDQAIKNDRLLYAINDGKGESFIRVHYIAPALKEQQRKYEKLLFGSTKQNVSFRDGNLLESEKATRTANRENTIAIIKAVKSIGSRSAHKW